MKKILSLAIIALIGMSAMAIPARPVKKTLTLADGTIVRNAVLSGDEYCHYWLAPDGTRYKALNDSVWQAIPEEEAAQVIRRASARKQEANAKRTRSLNIAPRGLLILVNFSDITFQGGNTQAEMDSMLNGQNYNYDQAIGSARAYFQAQSGGTYNPHFDVIGPVTLDNNCAYYGSNNNKEDGDDKLGDFVLHACQKADAAGVDFKQYDNDNDGYVDFVYLIYAGYGEADGGAANTLWPASWEMQSAVSDGYTSLSNRATASSYTFDGKILSSFAYSNELNHITSIDSPSRGFSSTNPKRCGIGTFCHEFSHVIGLPDYYDTQYGSNYDNNLTPGYWNLMDAGSYNMDGDVPPNYSIFDKYYVGWATPTILNTAQDVTLSADHFTGYYITSDGSAATPETTSMVYYLENRQQSGWDEGLPGHGLLVWKVKYNAYDWTNNVLNNTSGSPEYTYVPADGKYSDSSGDAGDTYPGTGKKTSCTLYTGYPITGIAENNGVITFQFMGGTPCEGYSATFTGTKSSFTASETSCIESGSSWTGTVKAANNCVLESVSVTMGGNTLSGAVTISADSATATISISSVSGDIAVSATGRKVGGSSTYDDCDEYTWEASAKLTTGTQDLGEYTWTIALTDDTYTGYETRGVQFGSKNTPVQQASFTTSDPANCLIEEVTVNAAMGSKGDGQLAVFIGGAQVGNTVSLASSSADYIFANESELQGDLEVRLTNSQKAVFLKSINVTFAEGGEEPSALEETTQTNAVRKYMENGRLCIEVGGVRYDIMGRKL